MKKIKSVDDIADLGDILCIFAHPDDETYLCGGIMALAVANGQGVACVTATKGEAGIPPGSDWSHEHCGEVRAQELKSALKILDIHNHHWLGYTDGTCRKVDDAEAVAQLVSYINEYKPDSILTFASDGLTGHADHQTVSRWATLAAKQSGHPVVIYQAATAEEHYKNYLKEADKKLNIYFNIDKPKLTSMKDCDICLELPENAAEMKYEALKSMPSQTAGMFKNFDKPQLLELIKLETFTVVAD
ncbi:MAG TPA: PIG-L family deacetylase [Patescibacteria group bacterium]|nr:PIG-L family deacetylase [Patescibacteria group bacterium]